MSFIPDLFAFPPHMTIGTGELNVRGWAMGLPPHRALADAGVPAVPAIPRNLPSGLRHSVSLPGGSP
jgi:hypothetical protein